MKIVLVPDSFKGSLSSLAVCRVMAEQLAAALPAATLRQIPVADGGEGSVEALLTALGGERVEVTVQGPYGEALTAAYGRLPDGVAIVEMAAAAGLPLVGERRRADLTTTYGAGELILHAAHNGARRIIVGLGGSATNDGGCGAAAACGVRFLRADGSAFVPVGGTLAEIARIDISARDPVLAAVDIVTMCDIDNPLCGDNGAAAVFGPQKGADAAMVALLDAGLAHLADLIARDLGHAVRDHPGAGAAGGMGAGMLAFFDSTLQMGIETVLDVVDFDRVLRDTDLVLTGEGRLDGQSLRGKVVVGVGRRCRAAGVPCVAVVGQAVEGAETAVAAEGVGRVVVIQPPGQPLAEAMARAEDNLRRAMAEFATGLAQRS